MYKQAYSCNDIYFPAPAAVVGAAAVVVVAAVVVAAVVVAAVVAADPGQSTFFVTLMKKNLVKVQTQVAPGFAGQNRPPQTLWHPIQGFRTKN